MNVLSGLKEVEPNVFIITYLGEGECVVFLFLNIHCKLLCKKDYNT